MVSGSLFTVVCTYVHRRSRRATIPVELRTKLARVLDYSTVATIAEASQEAIHRLCKMISKKKKRCTCIIIAKRELVRTEDETTAARIE